MSVEEPSLTLETRSKLGTLLDAKKFGEGENDFYLGAATPEQKAEFEGSANHMISHFLELDDSSTHQDLFDLFQSCLDHFEQGDTEDREQICTVCEWEMDAVGFSGSGGLLNKWL